MSSNGRMRIAVLFHRLGPYHHARLRAAANIADVTAVEFSSVDHLYAWEEVPGADGFARITLFHDGEIAEQRPRDVICAMDAALSEARPDVVAVTGWSGAGAWAGLLWCIRTGTPVVLMSESTAHDFPRDRWKEWVKCRLVKLCSAGLVGGEPQAQYMSALGIPRERIFTSYTAVDNVHFASGAAIARSKDHLTRARLRLPNRYFLASNRFIERKNLTRLLEAYAQYRAAVGTRAWQLVMLGDGPLRERLVHTVAELGITEAVVFQGFTQYDDLPAYYGLARAFIHASTSEQWGLVVNEAMAAGLPVIVSERCGCAPDLVRHGENGFVFDPFDVDALARLMGHVSSDDCDRAVMARAGREIIANWSPDAFARNLGQAAQVALKAQHPQVGMSERALLIALMHT